MSRTISVAAIIMALTAGCQRASGPASTSDGNASSPGDHSSTSAVHPLDPLTAAEIRAAVQVVNGDARFAGAAFPSVAVQDPAKADVLAWQSGQPLARRAMVQALTAESVYEVLVDLPGQRIVSAMERRGVEPSITLSEIERV